MSHRDTTEKKKKRLIKSLRNTPPRHIDLIDYIKLRTRCTTTTAKAVLLSGAVRVDSHPVGFRWEGDSGETRKVLYPYVEASYRDSIRIELPKAEKDE